MKAYYLKVGNTDDLQGYILPKSEEFDEPSYEIISQNELFIFICINVSCYCEKQPIYNLFNNAVFAVKNESNTITHKDIIGYKHKETILLL